MGNSLSLSFLTKSSLITSSGYSNNVLGALFSSFKGRWGFAKGFSGRQKDGGEEEGSSCSLSVYFPLLSLSLSPHPSTLDSSQRAAMQLVSLLLFVSTTCALTFPRSFEKVERGEGALLERRQSATTW